MPSSVQSDEWGQAIDQICRRDDWIIEGVNLIPTVLAHADQIIYVRPRLITALWRQWKRFFTDATQRKEHGFGNNLKLSIYLIRQYWEIPDQERINDVMYSRVRKFDNFLGKFKEKVKFLNWSG